VAGAGPSQFAPLWVERGCMWLLYAVIILRLSTVRVSHCDRSSVETTDFFDHLAVCQNLVPLVNIKIAGKWMFIPLKMVLIGIDP